MPKKTQRTKKTNQRKRELIEALRAAKARNAELEERYANQEMERTRWVGPYERNFYGMDTNVGHVPWDPTIDEQIRDYEFEPNTASLIPALWDVQGQPGVRSTLPPQDQQRVNELVQRAWQEKIRQDRNKSRP